MREGLTRAEHSRTPEVAAQWVKDWETRLPAMRGRLNTLRDRQATFRDPDTARILRERVVAIIGSAEVTP